MATKQGIDGTCVEIDEPGSYSIEAGDEFSLPFNITAGTGGDPEKFVVETTGDAVVPVQTFIVKPSIAGVMGSTRVVAILKAKTLGEATVTLGVAGKGADRNSFNITVVEKAATGPA